MQEKKEQNKLHTTGLDIEDGSYAPDNVLGGKYKVISVLGKGGMGTVYKALQVFLNKEFAIKVLDSRRVSDDVQMRRFQLEAKAAHSLNNPALVKVHDFGLLNNNQPYLVMDLVEGTTLSDYIRDNRFISVDQVEAIFTQVCKGLAYAHEQSVVHRDIKPSNIMLVKGVPLGVEGSIKILDFGIAKIASDETGEIQQLTRTGEIFGSPLYMSPEQCTGDLVDHRSDIYSLGCVMFEALTGTPPHFGNNALRTMMMHQSEPAPLLREASLGHQYPEALEQIVQKMLQKSPKDRYQNLSQVVDALTDATTNETAIAENLHPRKSASKPARTVTLPLSGLYALLIAAVIASALITTLISYALEKHPQNLESQKSIAAETKSSQEKQSTLVDDFTNPRPGGMKWAIPTKSIKATIVNTPGKGKQKEFNFPDYPMGVVSSRMATELGIWKGEPFEIRALGKVQVPANVPLTLRLNYKYSPAPFSEIKIFEKIDPSDYSELEVTGNPIMDQKEESQGLTMVLKAAQKWTNLEAFSLCSLYDESNEALEQISQLKHLRYFLLEGMSIAMAQKLKPSFWQQLKLVALANAPLLDNIPDGASPSDMIVSKLSGSTQLERLIFEFTRVSPRSLKKLTNCPRLAYVRVHYNYSISDEVLFALLKLPNLKTLELSTLVVSPEQFKHIASTDNLKQIIVDEASRTNFKKSNCRDVRVQFVVGKKPQNENE